MTLQISHFTWNFMRAFLFLVCWKRENKLKLTKICFYSSLSVILERNLDDIMSQYNQKGKKKSYLLCCITYTKHTGNIKKCQKKNTQTIEKGNKKIEINQDDSTFYREIQENRYVVRRNFNVFFLSAGFIRSEFFFFFWPTNATMRKQQ